MACVEAATPEIAFSLGQKVTAAMVSQEEWENSISGFQQISFGSFLKGTQGSCTPEQPSKQKSNAIYPLWKRCRGSSLIKPREPV